MSKKTKSFYMRCNPEFHDELSETAKMAGISAAEVVREGVKLYRKKLIAAKSREEKIAERKAPITRHEES